MLAPDPELGGSSLREADGRFDTRVKIVQSTDVEPVELRNRILALGRLMRPMRAIGFRKVRVGSAHDGGYVMIDDFKNIAAAFSLGIENNVDWDLAIAGRNIPVYQFDHSIAAPPVSHPLCKFFRAMIGPENGQLSLADIMSKHPGGALPESSTLMKMDIEHWEWPTLAATPRSDLRKMRQFVCEFHCIDLLTDIHWWRQAMNVFTALNQDFAIVHVHSNVIGGLLLIGGVPFPNVLEFSFANRASYELEETDEVFPNELDASNAPGQLDHFLGSFRF